MDDSTLRSIRILALNSVENPDWESSYRRICRWYSKEFSTPLKQVEDMSEFHVLLTYFEDKYQEMANSSAEDAKKNYDSIKEALLMKEETVEQAEQQKEMEDEIWAAQLAEEIKKEQEKDKQKQSDTANEPNLLDLEDRFELKGEDYYAEEK